MAEPKEIKKLVVQPDPQPTKVQRLLLHQPFTINGVTDQALYASKGFDMVYTAEGVHGEFKGFKFIVPLANIVCAYL